ncbi:MAG TPA: hypothetical protein VL987_10275 [Cellvibrio sp.]|nr:hypothetical protein [Cellvibrio sp.]
MIFNIDGNNMNMCRWAYEYLRRRYTLPANPPRGAYIACVEFLNTLYDSDRELLLRKMKMAWRQKEYRDRQRAHKKKPCSFILSETSLKILKGLAKGLNSSYNDTLERIIKETYHEDKERRKQARKKSPFKMMNQ